jgi:hypothetical protein
MTKLILLIIGLFVLGFIWLLWARHRLLLQLQEVQASYNLVLADMAHRRDLVPYLLESARHEEVLNTAWHTLLSERAVFHAPSTWAQEEAFEQKINTFLQIAQVNTLPFLEAKKDIEELSQRIEKQKINLFSERELFESLKKKFPYSLASGIFGLRNIQL